MSNDRKGWRSGLKCPSCGADKIWYTGDVDTTAQGMQGRELAAGAYLCKNPDCEKFEVAVQPVQQ